MGDRSFIDVLLVEHAEAQSRYDNALARVVAWEDNDKKRSAFLAELEKLGLSHKSSSRRVKSIRAFHEFNFDASILRTDIETLRDELKAAKRKLGTWNIDLAGPEFYQKQMHGSQEQRSSALLDMKNGIVDISTIVPMHVNRWDDRRWNEIVCSIPMDGRFDVGIGPGEERIVALFGGCIQGSNDSFDVLLRDGTKWEVKLCERTGHLIRPGTVGRRTVMNGKNEFLRVMEQLSRFISVVPRSVLSNEHERIINVIEKFLDANISNVERGEISMIFIRRFFTVLRSLTTIISLLERTHSSDVNVNFNGEKFTVSGKAFIMMRTFIRGFMERGFKLAHEENVIERALAELNHTAFDDPSSFIESWYSSVDVLETFPNIDGLFIVSSDGFRVVPRCEIPNVLKFEKVSQNLPRFRFVIPQKSEK